MNERIRELIIQTDEWLENNAQSNRYEREIKFAELIVQECASIVDNYGRWILYDKLAVKIKQHFGVTYD